MTCFVPGRSRKGAWIEIKMIVLLLQHLMVAPVRERGLKLFLIKNLYSVETSRSRKGAWIEILIFSGDSYISASRSRKGAWIEITDYLVPTVSLTSLP